MRILLTLFTILSISLLTPSTAWAEKQVMLVLDASGSMWGQIDGKPKISIAREVVDSMLKDWDNKNQIGLVTYGHRKKGDCKDIETLIPLGKLDAAAFNQAVASLNPKGKTPLTDAVRLAAEKLKYTENQATVILISDGKETCNADPCAVATELNKSGVDFTTHVIGFDVTEKVGLSQLQCMAKNTGGEFLSAKNASDLKAALKTAIKKVEEKPAPKVEAPEVDSKAPVNVHLYSVLKAGGEKFGGSWFKVLSETKDGAGQVKRKSIASSGYYPEVKFNIVPGSYIATAENGNAYVEVPLVIEPGKALSQEINLNAGRLKSVAYMVKGGKPEDGSWFKAYTESSDEFGKPVRKQAASTGYSAETVFVIPAGKYIATASKGTGSGETAVEVKAGEGVTADIIYNAGRVKLISYMKAGDKPVGGSWFYIYREDKDDFGKPARTKITGSGYNSETVFIVPAGSYIAAASKGQAYAEQPIVVEAGKGITVDLNYKAGFLKTISVAKAGGKPVGGSWFYVYREGKDEFGKPKETKVSSGGYYAETTFSVPAGDYIVRATNEKKKGSARVKVIAGKGVEVEIVLKDPK